MQEVLTVLINGTVALTAAYLSVHLGYRLADKFLSFGYTTT